MTTKNCKSRFGKIIVIAAVLMMGMGLQTAHAGNLYTSALNAADSGSYQAYAEAYTSIAFLYGDTEYLYDAAAYMDSALYYADEAYYYAGLVDGDWAYYAWLYADAAYSYFYDAADYLYLGYLYGNISYVLHSLANGGFGAVNIAYAGFFAGVGCYGGYY
ncbi:MAG: hypothetical protein R6X27_13995 [Candidatus Desulfacyla sp.]